MRASPYDLAHLGCEPIAIESAIGRQEYEQHQRALAEKARTLRAELASAAQALESRLQPIIEVADNSPTD